MITKNNLNKTINSKMKKAARRLPCIICWNKSSLLTVGTAALILLINRMLHIKENFATINISFWRQHV